MTWDVEHQAAGDEEIQHTRPWNNGDSLPLPQEHHR